jgi:menaquinone-dependent protoporphyrinogen oxidase
LSFRRALVEDGMRILVAFASRHGSTQGIGQRVAETLGRDGHDVTFRHVSDVGLVDAYDAFVVGSSAYMGHWEKEAADFVRRYRSQLSSHPTWLFSSGPVGSDKVDKQGRDVLEASRPIEFGEFETSIQPRDEHVFFGAYDPDAEPANLMERLGGIFTRMPAIRSQMPIGDYRDWPAIEAWAQGISRALVEREPAGVPA